MCLFLFQANKPMFLNIRAPVNMYEILCTEVHLELNKNELNDEEINILKEFLNKLNKIDPLISEKFVDKPSRIQELIDESRMSNAKHGPKVKNHKVTVCGKTRTFTNRERGRGQGRVQNSKRQINFGHAGSWRNKEDN